MPVVSTDVGDVAQVIKDVEGCWLCEPPPQDIAEKLRTVLSFRRRTNGRQKIGTMDGEIIARKIIGIYEELCLPRKEVVCSPPIPKKRDAEV